MEMKGTSLFHTKVSWRDLPVPMQTDMWSDIAICKTNFGKPYYLGVYMGCAPFGVTCLSLQLASELGAVMLRNPN